MSQNTAGLTWNGFPFEGDVAIFSKKDPKHKLPKLEKEAGCDIFELWNKEQLAQFQSLLQEISSGKKVEWQKDTQWIEEKQNWKVMIMWLRPYYTNPDGYRKELNSNG